MLYRSKIEVRKFSPKYKIVTPSKPLQDKGPERTKIITKPYRAEIIKPLRIGNRPIEKNDENISGTLKMHNIGDLRPWKELKPLTAPDRYAGSEYRKIHVIHWWYTDRTCQDLTEIEKFHFAMLNLSDFDNKFDEIYFSVAVSPSVLKGMQDPDNPQNPDNLQDTSNDSVKDFIIKNIKELTRHGRAAVYVKFIGNSSALGEYESWKNIFSLIDPSVPGRNSRDSKCTVIKKIPITDVTVSGITENPEQKIFEAESVSIPPLFEGFKELKPMTWIHKNGKDGFSWNEYKGRNVISFYSHFKGAKYLQEPAMMEDVKYWSYIMYKSLIYSESAWKESLMNLKGNRSRCAILQGGVGRRYETLLNYYQKTICPEMKGTGQHMAGTFYFYNTGLIRKYYTEKNLHPSLEGLEGLEGQLTHVSEFCSCFLAGCEVSVAVPEANDLNKYHMFTRKNLLGFYNEYLTEADRLADSKMDSVIYTVGRSTDSFIYMKENDSLREKFLIDETREGDNIDDRNSVYCELTGLYMLWKDRREWKGLDHYRRCMMKDGQPVSNYDIMLARNKGYRALLARYDMPFANDRTLEEANTRLMFPDIIREKLVHILDKREGFGSWFMEWIKRKTLREACFCNMMVAEREVVDEYCSLLFPSLGEFLKECRDEIPPRLLGYTTETMFHAWLDWKGIPYDPSYTIVTTKYAKYRK